MQNTLFQEERLGIRGRVLRLRFAQNNDKPTDLYARELLSVFKFFYKKCLIILQNKINLI